MFTKDIKSFKTGYDYLKGLDSLFFLYVFFPLLLFSGSYLALNNKKTGIIPAKEWDGSLILVLVGLAILIIVWEFYTYYKAIKNDLKSKSTKVIHVNKTITNVVYDEEEEEEITTVIEKEQPTDIKNIRQLLVDYRSIAIKLYQKHCVLSLLIVGAFACTNIDVFGYLYGILVIIISIEKPTIPRLSKKLELNKTERDFLMDGNELPE